MIFTALLLAQASTFIDASESGEPFAVEFDCRVTGLAQTDTVNVHARANFEEGIQGDQPFTVQIDSDGPLLPDIRVHQTSAQAFSNIRVYSDGLIFQLPFDQSRELGDFNFKSWPPVMVVWNAPDEDEGNVMAAGPCHVTLIEADQ